MPLESVRKRGHGMIAVVAVVATGVASCGGPDATPETAEMVAETVQGECRDVFGGDVCTWGTFSGTEVVEFGVTVPMASVEGVPETMTSVWPPAPMAVLAFPEGVEESTGFTHFELNWEHHGHPPEAFMVPHFDLHFYTITTDAISDILCDDDTKPETLPEGYVLPDAINPEQRLLTGLCVPSMGMHSMPAEQAASTEPFTATMLIGYYTGDLIFVEPMVSRAKLQEEQGFSVDMPSLEGLTEGIRYPTRFEAEFDASSRTYRMVLSELSAR